LPAEPDVRRLVQALLPDSIAIALNMAFTGEADHRDLRHLAHGGRSALLGLRMRFCGRRVGPSPEV
jgi:hypothetical protein